VVPTPTVQVNTCSVEQFLRQKRKYVNYVRTPARDRGKATLAKISRYKRKKSDVMHTLTLLGYPGKFSPSIPREGTLASGHKNGDY